MVQVRSRDYPDFMTTPVNIVIVPERQLGRPMQSDFWHTDDLTHRGFRQFYREWRPGDDASQPVMALHGSLTQSGMWNVIAEGLGSVRMLCPDQRGFGRSEDP